MSFSPNPTDPVPELWNDNIWDRLIVSLEEQCVIPIVGPDLLQVEYDGQTILLDQFVAQQLARKHDLPGESPPGERALNQVVCRLIRRGMERFGICDEILHIMKGTSFRPSRPLRQLAEITDFNLFVTTTFDSLLEIAVNEARFAGKLGTSSISYSPRRPDDLPAGKNKLVRPTIYHLMGRLSGSGAYVISDEDVLEYLCDLQSSSRRPDILMDELKRNHLLILGAGFSDWLSRFFLRTAKGERLSLGREFVAILADDRTHHDKSLVEFLLHFSRHTRIFRAGGAVGFVDELWSRWRDRQPEVSSLGTDAYEGREMPSNGIFISYSRKDLAAVRELHASLESAGLPVWFDQLDLGPGVDFGRRIEHYIGKECSCFVAVISRNTESHEGYFRREWNMAVERDRGIHHERRFIIPVVLDDLFEPSAVPLRFTQLNYTRLPGGRVSPAFVKELRQIVDFSSPTNPFGPIV